MKRSLIFIVSFLFFVGIVLFSRTPSMQPVRQLIAPDEVRGMGVVVQSVEYTLNFEQQNRVVEGLNSLVATKEAAGEPLFFEELIIYRFERPSWSVEGTRAGEVVLLTIEGTPYFCPADCELLKVLQQASYAQNP